MTYSTVVLSSALLDPETSLTEAEDIYFLVNDDSTPPRLVGRFYSSALAASVANALNETE